MMHLGHFGEIFMPKNGTGSSLILAFEEWSFLAWEDFRIIFS